MTLVLALDRKLLRHMEDVVSPILPVDVLQIEAEQFPFADRLLIAPSQQQRIINLLARADKSVGERLVKVLHCPFDVRRGELIFDAGIRIPVQPPQLPAQDVLQKNMVASATLHFAV